jgi:hypothetical protein
MLIVTLAFWQIFETYEFYFFTTTKGKFQANAFLFLFSIAQIKSGKSGYMYSNTRRKKT